MRTQDMHTERDDTITVQQARGRRCPNRPETASIPPPGERGRLTHGRLLNCQVVVISTPTTSTAETLTPMTTPLTARQRLSELHRYAAVSGEDFTHQNLASARTNQLRFARCSFAGADLRYATLEGCWFKFCDFSGADLRGASLRGAVLAGCDLRDADLRDTDLTGARLSSVNTGIPRLGPTDITGARFEGTSLRNVQADAVIGWPPGPTRSE